MSEMKHGTPVIAKISLYIKGYYVGGYDFPAVHTQELFWENGNRISSGVAMLTENESYIVMPENIMSVEEAYEQSTK